MSVVAITGAGGEIGQKLLARLEDCESINKIVGFDIKDPLREYNKLAFYRADIRHPQIPEILSRYKVETLLHLAFTQRSSRHVTKAHERDVIGTLKVLNACLKADIKRVALISSTMVYGASPYNPHFFTEEHSIKNYSHTKYVNDRIEIERLARQFQWKNPEIGIVVLRTPLILGLGSHNFMVRMLSQPVVFKMMGFDPLMQFLHEDDMIEALFLALTKEIKGVYNVCPDGVMPFNKALRIAGKISIPVIEPLAYPILDILWNFNCVEVNSSQLDYFKFTWVASGKKFKEATGFKPKFTTEQAFIDFIEQQRIRPYLVDGREELLLPDISPPEDMLSYLGNEEQFQEMDESD